DLNYEVRFIVEEKQKLTNFWCVPNPISDIGRFYYRLTGSQPVNQYIVQIHDMTGRLIRTLNQTDLGVLQPGLNVSNIWYTMQMPSGVYMFKFVDLSSGILDVQSYHNPENIDSESGNVLIIVD
nr:T9SS type A sorting domain-containing protein [Saprospiraceae bacterium]